MCDLVYNNPRIIAEEIAKRLSADNSTAFRHLKKTWINFKARNRAQFFAITHIQLYADI